MALRRNRVYAAVDEMHLALEHATYRLTRATDKRARLAGALLVVLLFHLCFLWILVNTRSDEWKSRLQDEEVTLIDTFEPPPPEPVVPIQKIKPVPKPVQQTQPQPQPSQPDQQAAAPAPAVQPIPVQATPQPVVEPKPVPAPVPAPIPAVVVPQQKPAPVVAPAAPPQPVAAPAPMPSMKIKKKSDDVLQKPAVDSVANVDDLNLHQVQATDVPALDAVPASGLSDNKPSAPANAPGGGRLGAMNAQGLPSGLNGVGLNGRGKLTQAMQNHDYCVAQQTAGKPIPGACDMASLTGMKPLGLKPDSNLQAAVAKKDADLRYQQAAGNDDYWKRVNHVPTTSDRSDDLPKPGSYTGAKDQRVMGGGGKTADQGPQ